MTPDIKTRYEQVRELGVSVCESMQQELTKMGLATDRINPRLERASFELSRDPASGEYSLIGTWRDKHGNKQGMILFHADGSFFAEYDVICEHPQKPHWFVEAVTAWGRDKQIKSEARLLPVAS
jgi:hypothetical protein